MKKIIVKDYTLKNGMDNNLNFLVFSDLHFSINYNKNILNGIKRKIIDIKPDYVFIVGDIIDGLHFVSNDDVMNDLFDFLYDLGNLNDKRIPVLVSLGNHDMDSYDRNNGSLVINDVNYYFNKYIKRFDNKNVYLLNSSYYVDDFIFVYGFTQNKDSFCNNSYSSDIEYFDSLYSEYNDIYNDRYKVALIHNPINLLDNDIDDKLRTFNLILSGHMHNGLVFNFLDKLIKNNYGFISPNRKLFPNNARGIIKHKNNRFNIISGGIIKFQWCSRFFHYFDFIYPAEIDNVIIK